MSNVTIQHPRIVPAFEKALAAEMWNIAEDMNQYCKWQSYDTANTLFAHMDGKTTCSIEWSTEYARYAYYTGTPSHGGTHLRWAEYAAQQHRKQWAQDIAIGAQKLWKR